MDIENIKNGVSKIKEGISILSRGPMDYYISGLIECQEEFFKRCAPFKVGDVVELTITPKIEKTSGLYHCRHFLVCGAKAEVVSVDFYKGSFKFDITFHNETWIDSDKNEQKVREKDKHSYCFDENKLRIAKG